MKILYISNEYPPETGYGGIATYTRHMAREMARLGHSVHVICRSEMGRNTEYEDKGIRVHRIRCGPYPLPRGRFWYPLRLLCYKVIPQSLIRLAWAKTAWETFCDLRKTHTFDIIEYPDCGAEGFHFSRKENLPLTVRLHTPWSLVRELDGIKEHILDRFLQAWLEKTAIRGSRAVSSPSHALSRLVNNMWNVQCTTVYPNPIPSSTYRKTNHNQRWIYTGRLEYRKGVHDLIKAYAQVCRTHSPPQLLLVGSAVGTMKNGTPYGEFIQNLITETKTGGKIRHIPRVVHKEVGNLLQNSSAAFFPSLWENFPYSCMEAMASGLIVAASECGGYPEMIANEINGLLFKPGDPDDLASVMRRILDTPHTMENLGEEARRTVGEFFDSKAVCRRAEQFYTDIIRSGRGA